MAPSQMVIKETPRKRPRVPPTSAKKENIIFHFWFQLAFKKPKYSFVQMAPSQIVIKETPRKRSRVPPTSAKKEDGGCKKYFWRLVLFIFGFN